MFGYYIISELPYDTSLLVKCTFCYRGIHMKCLSAEELDTIDSTGLTCLNCLSSRKKRALQFSSQAEECDPP